MALAILMTFFETIPYKYSNNFGYNVSKMGACLSNK